MYVDLDFDSYKSMQPLFEKDLAIHPSCLFLGRMASPKKAGSSAAQHSLCNAFMASTPSHEFWPTSINAVRLAWQEDGLTVHGGRRRNCVEHITGPVLLLEAYDRWTEMVKKRDTLHYLRVFPHTYVYPFAWYRTVDEDDNQPRPSAICQVGKEFDVEAARAIFNNGIAYACTYWGSSWRTDWLDNK